MSRIPRKAFWWSFAAHVAVILSLIVVPAVMNCRMRMKPAEIITYVDLQNLTVPVAAPEVPAVQPEPPPPEPRKDIPEPAPVKKKKIEVSKKKIKREETPAPPKSELTPEEIRKLLAAGAKPSSWPGPELDLPAWYFALVRQMMYDQWNQPGELAGAAGLMTRVQFRIHRDGSISHIKMIRASGSKVMDESVMTAVNAVKRLKELPASYREAHYDATVDFELTSGGF